MENTGFANSHGLSKNKFSLGSIPSPHQQEFELRFGLGIQRMLHAFHELGQPRKAQAPNHLSNDHLHVECQWQQRQSVGRLGLRQRLSRHQPGRRPETSCHSDNRIYRRKTSWPLSRHDHDLSRLVRVSCLSVFRLISRWETELCAQCRRRLTA